MAMRNALNWAFAPAPANAVLEVAHKLGLPDPCAVILERHGLRTFQSAIGFLDSKRYLSASPEDLPDLVRAGDILRSVIRTGELILVWGDFDVDGQTATSLLVLTLKVLGAAVRWYVPNRLHESHGIPLDALQRELGLGPVALLLTCDTGIGACAAIDYAKLRGIPTLVTDHHDLPASLPDAAALVNPKRLAPDHPLAELPGVGVAYKLAEHLLDSAGLASEVDALQDLAALGIVADVATLTRDTRHLLQRGLAVLRQNRRVGLQALCETAQINAALITADSIAFQIAPRLNAVGRLADASVAIELLTTTDLARARLLAAQIEGLNQQRRLLNLQIATAAHEMISRDPSLLDWDVLILAHKAWHPGIVGIVAAQLAQQYERPVIMLCVDEQGVARGSARSVPGVDIGAGLRAHSGQLISHGGHPGAAGLTLLADAVPAFRRQLSETIRLTRVRAKEATVMLDAEVSPDFLNLNFAAQVERLAPFGPGNPAPVFLISDLQLENVSALGRAREHRRLTVRDNRGNTHRVLWWDGASLPLPAKRFDLACHISTSDYAGKRELEITLVSHRPALTAPVIVSPPKPMIVDRRGFPDPHALIAELRSSPVQVQIWAEGLRRGVSPGVPLTNLGPADVLLVFTTPPCSAALQQALQRISPSQVHVLAIDPPLVSPSDVYQRILELVKYAVSHLDGQLALADLAGAVAQPESVVRLALATSVARGDITLSYRNEGLLSIRPGGTPLGTAAELQEAFRAGVAETAAYRAFFHRAELEQLIGALEQ